MQAVRLNRYFEWIDGALLVAALILLTYGLGQYGLFEPHEGHFAGAAREMILRQDWITPALNGAPYLNKPPLLYWLIAASFQVLGFQEFAARLPIALVGWSGVIIAWLWSRQIWGVIASRAAVVLLSTSIGWFIFAHQLLIDELLGTLLLGMMYCLWRLTINPKAHSFFVTAYVLLGLAVLAKGILALAFWAAGCGAIALTHRRWQTLRLFRPVAGIAITAAVVLPWCIAVERANPGFMQYFLLNENFKRALDTRWPPDYSVSKVSWWGYLAVSAVWCLPWMFLLPPALRGVFQDWRRGLHRSASLEDRHRNDALTLLGVLALLPILLFLPLSSRLYYYSVPAIPPLAMMTGAWWSMAWHGKAERSRVWIGWIMTALGVALATGLLWLPEGIIDFFPELSQTKGVRTVVAVQLIGLSVGFIGSGAFLLRKQLAVALVLLWFGFGTTWACVIQGFKSVQDVRSSKNLVIAAKTHLKTDALWIFEGSRELGAAGAMSFYLGPGGIQVPKNPTTQGNTLVRDQDDWVRGASGTMYQTLFVLADGGATRQPPTFPGPTPKMLITKAQMQQYWNGSAGRSQRPVVFVTDFLRQLEDYASDPLTLNLPQDAGKPLLEIGSRKLYGNAQARELWLK